jgi:hypothetical protein
MSNKQKQEAEVVMGRARLAMEAALPRGSLYVSVISVPGAFNTWAHNMTKQEAVSLLQGLLDELRKELLYGG